MEFVLILPLFALLLFGIVDFGSVFGGYISVQNEVNAAAREISLGALPAACNPPSGGQNPGLCTIEQYVSGSISGSTDPLGTTGQVKVAVVFPNPPAVGGAVTVCAQALLKSMTGMTSPFLNGRSFYTKSTIKLEQDPNVFSPPQTGGTITNTVGFTCT